MKRYFTYFFLLIALVVTGCEGAKAPMGYPNEVKLDNRLLGTWTSGTDDDDVIMTITAINDSEYGISYRENGEEEAKEMNLRAFESLVGGVQFANVTCLNCDDGEEQEEKGEEWFFFAFDLESDNVLAATALDDDVYKKGLDDLTEIDQIRAYVLAHLNDADFFEEEVGRFVRKTE